MLQRAHLERVTVEVDLVFMEAQVAHRAEEAVLQDQLCVEAVFHSLEVCRGILYINQCAL